MAAATTTTLGEIVLAGDFTGDANYPELRPSGVTPGTYAPAMRVSIDSKGRTTAAGQLTQTELISTADPATTSSKGLVCIGSGLSVSSGVISVANAGVGTKGIFSVPVGGGLQLSGTQVQIDYTQQQATGSVFGFVKSGANITNTGGTLSIVDATDSIKGAFTLGAGLGSSGGAATIDVSTSPATGSVFGFVKAGANISISAGVLSIADATSGVKGFASYGAGLSISSGAVTFDYASIDAGIPDATSSVLGKASYSSAFTVSSGAVSFDHTVLSSNLTVATGSVFGAVKSGTNITNTAGVLSIADATNSTKGVCSVDTASGLSVSSGQLGITNVVKRSAANSYTAAQNAALTSTTLGGTTFTPNFQTGAATTDITLSGNLTINFPSTLAPAGCSVRQDILLKFSTAGTYVVTLSGTYKTNGTLSFTNSNVNATDVLSLICTDTVCYAILNEKFQ